MAGDVETLCREIYRETREFYESKKRDLEQCDFGFRILYGPPVRNPPILFVGMQPGGNRKDMDEEEHSGWPSKFEYAVAEWKLARNARLIWDVPTLERCTGLNFNFFRSPDEGTWNALPK